MKKLLLYLFRRVLMYIAILFLALTAFFFVVHLGPGDPVLKFLSDMQSRYGYNPGTTDQGLTAFKVKFGLDQPVGVRYLRFMEQFLLHGNFGPSMTRYPSNAQDVILEAMPWTLGLLVVAVLLSWILGMALGTILGWRRGTRFEGITTPVSLVFSQIPVYLMAILLATLFVYVIAAFPNGYAYTAGIKKAFTLPFIGSVIYHAVLPAMSMILVYIPGNALGQRAMVINLLGEDYMKLAEAKGLSNGTIINRYILRNTLLPQATGLALSLGFVVNGFFLIEWIFRYPGVGFLFVGSITAFDYNVILGIAVISMVVVLLANLIIEFLYPLIDPRIRRG
jgi:peptide/nickel transport system permease protein